MKSIKSIIKKVALLLFKLIPERVFKKFIAFYARSPRSKSKMGYYFERFVNHINKNIIIEKLRPICWYHDSKGDQFSLFNHVVNNFTKQSVMYLEFGVYRGGGQ